VRRFRSIALATALELLSEPLSLLITLTALALTALAPALHYHQFGEPSRMARDAGFSAMLLGGCCYVAFGAFRTFRREVETGTMQVALAHSVSRSGFFLAKVLGCGLAYAVFVLTVGSVSLTVVNGAEIGAFVVAGSGGIARIWGVSLAIALLALLLPLGLAALLNRFVRMRFTLTASLLALTVALLGVAYRPDFALALRLMPASVLFSVPALVLLAAVSAFAVRFRPSVAATLTMAVVVLLVPALGNYCLSEALARGGSVPIRYFWMALAAIVPAVAAFLVLGVGFINGKDAA